MQFDPWDDDGQNEGRDDGPPLLEDGTYTGKVIGAWEQTSKAENPMIKLLVVITASDGSKRDIQEYLVLSDGAKWRIRSFADATGLMQQFNAGNLAASDCMHRKFLAAISTEEAKGKFKARNRIDRYQQHPDGTGSAQETETAAPAVIQNAAPPDDDLPF